MLVYVVTEQCIHEDPLIEGVFHDRERAALLADGSSRLCEGVSGPGRYIHSITTYDTETGREVEHG